MATYLDVKNKLNEMAKKLEETKDVSAFSAGPVNDSVKIIVPMMEDMLDIVRDVLDQTVGHE